MKIRIVFYLFMIMFIVVNANLLIVDSEVLTFDSTFPVVTISSPAGGEIFAPGDTLEIGFVITEDYFAESPAEPVHLEFYFDDVHEVEYNVSLPAAEDMFYGYNWIVPGLLSENVLVKVSASDYYGNFGEGLSGAFTIDPMEYVHNVTQDNWYDTIQEGIDASDNGDIILVEPGNYLENINFNGKVITLGSLFYTTQDTSYISQTIIDGNQNGSVVTFNSGENIESELTGFTIINGNADNGGGISCLNSHPTINKVIITGNMAAVQGGGIYCEQASPHLLEVMITNNSATLFGGGIYCCQESNLNSQDLILTGNTSIWGGGINCQNSNPNFENTTITNNVAYNSGGGIFSYGSSPQFKKLTIAGNTASFGGGIYCDDSHADFVNATITDNSGSLGGGGLYSVYSSTTFFVNCILWNNFPQEIYFGRWGICFVFTAYSDIEGGPEEICHGDDYYNGYALFLEGSIDSDPLFADPEAGDYTLLPGSPCIDAGIAYFYYAGEILVYIGGDEFLGSSPDIGAFEYNYTGELISSFVSSEVYGYAPLAVQFTDLSSGNPVSWQWDFQNDGSIDSEEQNPAWTYTEPGTYSVSLTINDDEQRQSSTEYKYNYITAIETNVHNITQDIWYETIQTSIDEATADDVLIVEPGTYYENIIISGKRITLASLFYVTQDSSYISQTIIDGNQNGDVVTFEDGGYLLEPTFTGFTITGGGSGIRCNDSDPLISNTIIVGNSSSDLGGGFFCVNSDPQIESSIISNNSAPSGGTALYFTSSSNPIIKNTTITRNSSDNEDQETIFCSFNANLIMVNCILWNDSPQEIVLWNSQTTIAFTDIAGGIEGIEIFVAGHVNWQAGNIDEDPLFVDAEANDYHLQLESPCIDAGTAYFEYNGDVILNIGENDYFGTAPDMGVYERYYQPIVYGDIDDNGEVESYDASLILMYLVDMDPIPEDPVPWEEWRMERADVDLGGDIEALDAAYILQYVVQIITELPVINGVRSLENIITITNDDEYLYFKAEGSLISLEYQVKDFRNVKTDEAEVLSNCLYYENVGHLALVSAEGVSGNILRIAYERTSSMVGSIVLEMNCNGYQEEIRYTFSDPLPEVTQLNSIYPNPFNPVTTIDYEIAAAGNVKIEVYNIKGQKVTVLMNERKEAGNYTMNWHADGMNTGIYFLRFTSGGYQKTSKVLLLK
ncbi:MAG: T9SS type A sorting domain-containing protein [Candidatus Cloacimonetes bacterium]|nr:T9SS type A sorting domain-containing protein [Candidatus Cloacimonadota bacterium]